MNRSIGMLTIAAVFAMLVVILAANPARSIADQSQGQMLGTQSSSAQLQLSLQPQQYVKITSPLSSNVSIVSVSGGLYSASISNSINPGTNTVEIVPINSSIYKVLISINASGPNFAAVAKQGNFGDVNLKNVTNYGPIFLYLTINSTGMNSYANGGWDPLFGMTGFRVQAPPLNFGAAIAIVSLLGVLLLGLGLFFHSRVSYLGLVLLLIVGSVVLGLLTVLGIVSLYLTSFVVLNLIWRLYSRRSR